MTRNEEKNFSGFYHYTFITWWTKRNFQKSDMDGFTDFKQWFYCWYKHKPTMKKMNEGYKRHLLSIKYK